MSRSHSPWWVVGLGAALVAAALAVDAVVSAWMTAPAVGPPVESAIDKLTDLTPVLILLGVLGSFPNRRRLLVGFLAPLGLHIPLLHLLKWSIGRARPELGVGAFHFEPFAAARHCDAFPSGHMASAGVLALVLGLLFPRGRIVFYAWAALVGIERVACGWHFLSDVIAGFLLAAAVVYSCGRWLGPTFYRLEARPVGAEPQDGGATRTAGRPRDPAGSP